MKKALSIFTFIIRANYEVAVVLCLFFLIKLEQKKSRFCVCVYEQSVVSGGHDITIIGCTFIQNVHVLVEHLPLKDVFYRPRLEI